MRTLSSLHSMVTFTAPNAHICSREHVTKTARKSTGGKAPRKQLATKVCLAFSTDRGICRCLNASLTPHC